MKIALDTSILVHAYSFDDLSRQTAAIDVIARLPYGNVVVPLRVLVELVQVLTRTLNWTAADAAREALVVAESFDIVETSLAALFDAMDLAVARQLPIHDALTIATAAEAGCGLLLTEALPEGFAWNGVTVTNPFQAKQHVWLEKLIDESREPY